MRPYDKRNTEPSNQEGQTFSEGDADKPEFVSRGTGSSNIDSIDRTQTSDIVLQQSCMQNGHKSMHNDKILYGDSKYSCRQHGRRLLFRDIKARN